MDPRPVVGQREYRLSLQIDQTDREALLETYEDAFFEVHGFVGRDDDGSVRAEWLVDSDDRVPPVWRVHVQVEPGPTTTRVTIRAQRNPEDLHDVLPPAKILDAIWAPLDPYSPRTSRTRCSAGFSEITWPDFTRFKDDLLLSPWRELPLVVLTPGGRHSDANAARDLAADLRGVAHVVRFVDTQSTFRLSDLVGRERGVYGGAVRIYRPGFRPESDPLDHDLMVSHYLDTRLITNGMRLSDEIARRILPLAGEPLPALHTAPETEPTAETDEEPEHVRRIRELEAQNWALQDERDRLRLELDRVRSEAATMERRLHDLETRIPQEQPPGTPWRLLNPRMRDVTYEPAFLDQVTTVARDGSLAGEVQKKMESVLSEPENYGKPPCAAPARAREWPTWPTTSAWSGPSKARPSAFSSVCPKRTRSTRHTGRNRRHAPPHDDVSKQAAREPTFRLRRDAGNRQNFRSCRYRGVLLDGQPTVNVSSRRRAYARSP